MRLMECLTLRVKDIDFGRREIRIRRGKGGRDRLTILPDSVCGFLEAHLARVRARYEHYRRAGGGAATIHRVLAQ